MTKIISHLKLLVPVIEEPPQELIDAFIKGCLRAAPKTYRHLKENNPVFLVSLEKPIILNSPAGLSYAIP